MGKPEKQKPDSELEPPVVHYELHGRPVYVLRESGVAACVGDEDDDPSCERSLRFPSVNTLVSVGALNVPEAINWHSADITPSPDTKIHVDLEADDADGDESKDTRPETARISKLTWDDGADDTEDDEATATTRYVMYFESGRPAMLSDSAIDSGLTGMPHESSRPYVRAGLFRNRDTPHSRVPVAIHLSGTRPLVSPDLKVTDKAPDATVYESVKVTDDERPSIAFVHRGKDDSAVATQLLTANPDS